MIQSVANRRDMEPPDAFSTRSEFTQYKFIGCSCLMIMLIQKSTKSTTLRLKGGGENDDTRFNVIPNLTDKKFMWNGLPCIDFHENVLYPLQNGLGSILHEKSTLLQTVEEVDEGGVRGNPPRAIADEKTINASVLRNTKAYSCILNYIDEKSETINLACAASCFGISFS